MPFRSPEEFLKHVLRAIAPYLDGLVLVGGFAVWLYRFHPQAAGTEIPPLLTFDVDFAASTELGIKGGRSLSDLLAAAGLELKFFGDSAPPVMKFFSKRAEADAEASSADQYYVEFLTPLVGPAADRAGRVMATKEIQKGVAAQRLRFLDLLTVNTWEVGLDALPGMQDKVDGQIRVRLPHPGLLIVQKVLIAGGPRRQEERPKDMAYIYEVLVLFRRQLDLLARDVREITSKVPPWRKWLGQFKRKATELFRTPEAPGILEAEGVLAASWGESEAPTSEMIHAAVWVFLRNV